MEKKEIDFKLLYPNLIVFLGANNNESLFKKLKKSFREFLYEPFDKETGTRYKHELGREVCTCRIIQGSETPVCLAEGEGPLPCDAEQKAVESLLNKLCDLFYVIRANLQFFTRKHVPVCALEADPSQSHVYRVVFLRNNSTGTPFPKPVSGAVNYVDDYNQLFAFIEKHGKSGSKADLFILNVLKSDRPRIRQVCQANGLMMQYLIGCSDMGIHAYRNMSTPAILHNLLQDGGKNAKYRLIGPRDKYPDIEDKPDVGRSAAQSDQSAKEEEEIVVNPWIADHLVLMDYFTEDNKLECPREIIFQSVRDCPDTEGFIIEKIRNRTGMIHAEALIDRNVVGRARSFQEKEAKRVAADDAFHNLVKCCYYIEAKKSYFGSGQDMPYFLRGPNSASESALYRIVDRDSVSAKQVARLFRSTHYEDFYFLNNFSKGEKEEISNIAKRMRFLVRWIGKGYLCVSRKRKPKEVLKELLSTASKENEKYRLNIPLTKTHQQMGLEATHQRTPYTAQANIQPVQGSTQAHTSDYQPANVDHTSYYQSHEPETESQEQEDKEVPKWIMSFIESAPIKKVNPLKLNRPKEFPKVQNPNSLCARYNLAPPKVIPPQGRYQRPMHNTRYRGPNPNVNFQNDRFHWRRPAQNNCQRFPRPNENCQESNQRSDANFNLQGQNQIPNQHVHFQETNQRQNENIQFQGPNQRPNQNVGFQETNQRLNVNRPIQFQEPNQRPDLNVSFQRTDQTTIHIIKEEDVNPSNASDRVLTLSERLQRTLEQQNLSKHQDSVKRQNDTSNKRSPDYLIDVKEDWEPKEKDIKLTADPHSTQYNSSFGMPSSRDEKSSIKLENESWKDSSTLYDRRPESTHTNNPPWNLGTPGTQFHSSFGSQSSKDDKSSVKLENESWKDSSMLFDRRPESTQTNNPLWNQGTKQQYDQRRSTTIGGQPDFANLFDHDEPQEPRGPAGSMFPTRSPPNWNKQKPYKNRGHSFGKLAKYCNNKGPRGRPY